MKKLFLAFIALSFFSCSNSPKDWRDNYKLPKGVSFPEVDSNSHPTQEKVDLGRILFFDPILSKDSTVSCGTCHVPSLAYSDGQRMSKGVNHTAGFRNTPGLINLWWMPVYFADFSIPTLEMLVEAPLHAENEMFTDYPTVIEKLRSSKRYIQKFDQVWGKPADPYTLTRSLSAFMRSLVSFEAPIDKFIAGDTSALSALAFKGFQIFSSDSLNCISCHNYPHFSDYQLYKLQSDPLDKGRMRISDLPEDEGKFRTPSLRNLAITAPYLHNGSLKNLEEVIEFYANPTPDMVVLGLKPFKLQESEANALKEFLKSLTDSAFIEKEKHNFELNFNLN